MTEEEIVDILVQEMDKCPMSFPEIAHKLGIQISSVKYLYESAISKIRKNKKAVLRLKELVGV